MAIELNQAQEDVAGIFLSYFNRAPEFQAMQYWVGAYQELVASFGDSPTAESDAFKALSASIYASGAANGEVPQGSTITNAWYVNYVYQNVLGRAPDADGATYWTTQLDNGSIDRGELVSLFIASARAQEGSRDALYVENRTTVAVEFAQWENSNPNLLPSLQYNQADVLAGVNEDPATVDAALDKMYSSTGGGESFTLTAGIDDLVGTSGNDIFNAYNVKADGTDGTTLNGFDKVDGGAGTDTLNIYVTPGQFNDGFPANASVKNVEIINILNADKATAVADSLTDAANYQGVQELWQFAETAATVTNLGAGTIAGFNGSVGDLTVEAAKAASSASIALAGSKGSSTSDVAVAVSGEALNAVTITGTIADGNTADTDDAYVDLTITVGKDQQTVTLNTEVETDVTIDDSASTKKVSTFDGSASTGAIGITSGATLANITTGSGDDLIELNTAFTTTLKSASVSAGEGDDLLIIDTTGDGDVTVDMGAGNDTVVLAAIDALSVNSVIDGGDGDDVLVTEGAILDAEDYTLLNELFVNFEGLAFTTTAAEFDASRLTNFDAFELEAGGKVVNLSNEQTVTTGDDLEVTAAGYKAGTTTTYAGELDILVEADATVTAGAQSILLSVEADEATAVTGTLAGDVQQATVEVLNYVDEDDAAAFGQAAAVITTVDGGALDALTTLTLSGNGTVIVNNGIETALVTVDASALASVDVNGDPAAGLVYTSDNAAVETITLGDGIDTVTLNASTVAATDTVVNLNLVADDAGALDLTASDVLTLGAGGLTATAIGAVTANNFDLALVQVATNAAAANGIVFSFGEDTYVYVDDGNGAVSDNDALVKIVGLVDQDLLVEALAV